MRPSIVLLEGIYEWLNSEDGLILFLRLRVSPLPFPHGPLGNPMEFRFRVMLRLYFPEAASLSFSSSLMPGKFIMVTEGNQRGKKWSLSSYTSSILSPAVLDTVYTQCVINRIEKMQKFIILYPLPGRPTQILARIQYWGYCPSCLCLEWTGNTDWGNPALAWHAVSLSSHPVSLWVRKFGCLLCTRRLQGCERERDTHGAPFFEFTF